MSHQKQHHFFHLKDFGCFCFIKVTTQPQTGKDLVYDTLKIPNVALVNIIMDILILGLKKQLGS